MRGVGGIRKGPYFLTIDEGSGVIRSFAATSHLTDLVSGEHEKASNGVHVGDVHDRWLTEKDSEQRSFGRVASCVLMCAIGTSSVAG